MTTEANAPMSADDRHLQTPTPSNYQRTTGGHLHWMPPTVARLQQLLPGYEVIEMLGAGGMGAVYKARQISLDRLVAIKILPPEAADSEMNFAERFRNEARTMAKMNHPAIVSVYDFGQTSAGQLYIVMEFIDGTDVARMILAETRLSAEYALAITAHVCDALQYAHSHGVVHRDIKPANVLINRDGQVKVADFGLAKASDAGALGLTKTNMALGTPDFVAPEALIPGMLLDGRADLYAVGVMLYNMLTGEIPRGMFSMPSMKLGTDRRFDAIIAKALQTDRESRYQSALEIRADLDRIVTVPLVQAGGPSSAIVPKQMVTPIPEAPTPTSKAKSSKPKAGPIVAGAATLVILAALYWLFVGGGGPSESPDDHAPGPAPRPPAPAPAVANGVTPVTPETSTQTASPPPPDVSNRSQTPATAPNPREPTQKIDRGAAAAPVPSADAAAAPKAVTATAPSKPPPPGSLSTAAPVSSPTVPMAPLPADALKILNPVDSNPVAKRLAELEAQFANAYEQQAGRAYQEGIAKLNASFLGALVRTLATATKAGNLEEALAIREEKQRVSSGQGLPPADLENLPQSLKSLRATYRTAVARLVAERDKNAAPLLDFYDQALARYQAELTQEQKLDDALKVKARRDEVARRKPKLDTPADAAVAASPQAASGKGPALEERPVAGRNSRWFEAARWAVSVGGLLTAVKNGQNIRIETEKDIPAGRFEIRDIVLTSGPKSASIADDDLARFSGLKELELLEIRGIPVSDAAFAFLPTTPALRHLVIDSASLTDGLISFLAPLQKLQILQIQQVPKFTGQGLERLASLRTLQTLWLSASGVGDDAIKCLANAANLEILRLDGCDALTDAGIAPLGTLTKLREISVGRCGQFTGSAFAEWSPRSSLQSLDIGTAATDPKSLAYLAKFPGLEQLNVNDVKGLDDQGLQVLAPLVKIRHISAVRTGVTGTGFASLSAWQDLKSLLLHYETPITGAGLAVISKTFPKLEKLALGPGTTASGDEAAVLSAMTGLKELELTSPKMGDDWLRAACSVAKLERLYVANAAVTDKGLPPLKSLKVLNYLSLSGCPRLTDAAVETLKDLKALRTLDLYNTNLSTQAIGKLRQALQACEVRR